MNVLTILGRLLLALYFLSKAYFCYFESDKTAYDLAFAFTNFDSFWVRSKFDE